MPLYITVLYGFCIVVMLSIGILVLLKDHRSPVHRSFFFFALSMVVWMAFLYAAAFLIPSDLPNALILIRLTFGASVFIPLFLSLFFYYFPRKIFTMPRWLLALFYVSAFILAGISAFTPLIEESMYMHGVEPFDVFGPMYPVYLGYVLFHFIFALSVAVRKLWISTGVEKKKTLYVSLGFFVFIFLAIMTNVVLPVFGIFIWQREAVAFSLALFFAVFYTVYRHRFFNLNFLVLNFMRGLLLVSFFIGSLFIIDIILENLFPDWDRNAVLALSLFVTFFVFRYFEKVFPDFYSGSFRNFKKSVAEFGSRIFDCKQYAELADLLQMIFVEKLNLKKAGVFLVEKEEIEDGMPVYLEDRFTDRLRKIKDVLAADELADKMRDKDSIFMMEKMRELDAKLCFPLFSEEKLIGFFILGRKKDAYMREEIEEILKIIPSLQTCVMNLFITSTLREENDIMKKIIGERTETLRKNNEKLEKMLRQQDSFISLTAHEFRTPLTVAMLGLEQLSYLHRKRIPEDVIGDVETSYNQLNKLTHLINRLLEMRRLEDDKVPIVPEKFELVSFVEEIIKNMRLIGATEGIEIEFIRSAVKSAAVFSDKVKLQQVLDNLLQNACKFTPRGGKITVTLKVDRKNNRASVSVKDTGVGIPEKDLEVIFEKFQQGSRYNQGVGIGLFLCHQYMNLLKGSIGVKSKLNGGSIFTIEFPLK